MPVFRVPKQLAYRHLLYTAVTRARSLLILTGSAADVRAMIDNDRKVLRYSGMAYFMTSEKGLSL